MKFSNISAIYKDENEPERIFHDDSMVFTSSPPSNTRKDEKTHEKNISSFIGFNKNNICNDEAFNESVIAYIPNANNRVTSESAVTCIPGSNNDVISESAIILTPNIDNVNTEYRFPYYNSIQSQSSARSRPLNTMEETNEQFSSHNRVLSRNIHVIKSTLCNKLAM